ncbi:DUF6193 family natural product biosynthesis protein [Streptomyces sp. NPDC060030]|uniref:DUF6193 family natural product biosynthesis protein n=1 Tax=Streptomyces sp. NPDC060030 TaxID=3347042 RepID=UPI003688236C
MTEMEDHTQPTEIVAAAWRGLFSLGDDLIDSAMLHAAYAEPRLRELFPKVSHGALRFSRCTRYPWTKDVGTLLRRAGGGFVVHRQSDGALLGEPETVEEAVALIVANLPDDCGPAIDGTADDL